MQTEEQQQQKKKLGKAWEQSNGTASLARQFNVCTTVLSCHLPMKPQLEFPNYWNHYVATNTWKGKYYCGTVSGGSIQVVGMVI